MKQDRRQFNLGFTTALFGLGMSQRSSAQKSENSTAPGSNAIHHYFFKDPTFEMIFLTSVGRAYHCGGNVGKVLYLTRQVEDGNFESAYRPIRESGMLIDGGHTPDAQAFVIASVNGRAHWVDVRKGPSAGETFLSEDKSLSARWSSSGLLTKSAKERHSDS